MSENNICFILEEKENNTDVNVNVDIFNWMNNNLNIHLDNYEEYTVKELMKISSYYDIDKYIKSAKCKKQDIIHTIRYFESLPENAEIVQRRQELWNYIFILSNDSKMKKYILWS